MLTMTTTKQTKTQLDPPHYNVGGGWSDGGAMTLYLITDKRTGSKQVRPGPGTGCFGWDGIGPEVNVRRATRSEAQLLWSNPVNPGWEVSHEACLCPSCKSPNL